MHDQVCVGGVDKEKNTESIRNTPYRKLPGGPGQTGQNRQTRQTDRAQDKTDRLGQNNDGTKTKTKTERRPQTATSSCAASSIKILWGGLGSGPRPGVAAYVTLRYVITLQPEQDKPTSHSEPSKPERAHLTQTGSP